MPSRFSEIQKNVDRLSYSERLFAEYALKNQSTVIHMPIASLADALGIASSTIISACKKLGYSGYKDFKIELASAPNNPLLFNWDNPPFASSSKDIYHKVIHSNIAALQETLETMDFSKFEEAANVLINADTIYVLGESTAAILAEGAYDFLIRLGLKCIFSREHQYKFLFARHATPSDAALIVTQSGVNRNTLAIAEVFKKSHCPIIGISNFSGTAFANISDILIASFPSPTDLHENNFSFRIPINCTIETLFYVIIQQNEARFQDALKHNTHLVWTSTFGDSRSD